MRWLAEPLHPLEPVVLVAAVFWCARRLFQQLPPSELPWLRARLRRFVAACRARLIWDAAWGSLLTVGLLLACWALLPGPWKQLRASAAGPWQLLRDEPFLLVRALLGCALLFGLWTWLAALFSPRHRWLRVVTQLRDKGRRADLSPDARSWCAELAACTRLEHLLALHGGRERRSAALEAWRRWTGEKSAQHPADLFWLAVAKLARREDPQLDAKSEAYQRIRARFAADATRLRELCAARGSDLLDGVRVNRLRAGPLQLVLAALLLGLCVGASWLLIARVRTEPMPVEAPVEKAANMEVE